MNKPSQPNDLTVATGWVEAIVATAVRSGVERGRLLAAAGMGALPVDPLARIPLDAVVRLWRCAVELTSDPAFGLRMGASIEPASLDVMAYTLVSSASLRAAIAQAQRFQRLVSDGSRMQLVEQHDMAWLVYHPVEAALPFLPQQAEAVLACTVRLLRWIVCPGFSPSRIRLAHAPISPLPAYRDMLGGVPEFQSAFSGIGIPLPLLDAPLPARNPEIRRLHETLASRHLASLENWISIRARVAAVLEQALPRGSVQRATVSAELGMTPRALQHRLAEEGTNFLEVFDEVRRKLAIEYVADPSLSAARIAALLDFSDASAFYRAFRRWTGQIPGEYRRTAGH